MARYTNAEIGYSAYAGRDLTAKLINPLRRRAKCNTSYCIEVLPPQAIADPLKVSDMLYPAVFGS